VFAASKIHGVIEPIVIPEVQSMQLPSNAQSPERSLTPSFETNVSEKIFSQTIVEEIGGVRIYTFMTL
jgi:hypothetical protein